MDFLLMENLVFRCFANEHFSNKGKPYVPIGESFPYDMAKEWYEKVHAEIQRLLTIIRHENTGI